MNKDYARKSAPTRKKSTARQVAKKTTSRKSASRARSEHRNSWSAPSFSAGVVFGAALVLVASYAPSAFEESLVAVRQQVDAPEEAIEFVFPEILENGSVEVDTSVYPAEFPDEDPNAPADRYLIQAISLKSHDAAASLSADLNAAGMSARFERVDLKDAVWYRIMVGPFRTRQEATRTMTELRRRNMNPRLNKLG